MNYVKKSDAWTLGVHGVVRLVVNDTQVQVDTDVVFSRGGKHMRQFVHLLLGADAWLAVVPPIINFQGLEWSQRDRLSLRNIFDGIKRVYGAVLFEFGEGWSGKGFINLWLDELRTVMWVVGWDELSVSMHQYFFLELKCSFPTQDTALCYPRSIDI